MAIRPRRLLSAGAAVIAVVAGTLVATGAIGSGGIAAPGSLRALGSQVGLSIGTGVLPTDLSTPSISAIVTSQFSSVTPEDQMVWQAVEPSQGVFDWSGADAVVAFAEQNNMAVQGSSLLWHNHLPSWLTTGVANGTISDTQLSNLLHQFITAEVSRYRGKISQWDVASELFTDSDPSQLNPNDFWISNLGPGIVADAFTWAHEADPRAKLFYTDYNIAGEDGSNAKSDAVYAWLQQMLAHGVPINGVGDEGHLDTQFGFSGQQMTSDLQRFASLHLQVAITEADVRTFVNNPTDQVPTDNLAQYAQPYEFSQMLKACLLVPQCKSFTVWGPSDADSWVPSTFIGEGYATLYDVNENPKLAFYDLQQDLTLAAGGAQTRIGFDGLPGGLPSGLP